VTYTNFSRFLQHKGTVESIEVKSTLSVSHGGDGVVWSSESLKRTFRGLGSIFDPSLWRMLFEIARFNVSAVRVLSEDEDVSISEYLDREGYSPRFKDDFLLVCGLSHPNLCGCFKPVIDLS
jgi:predicted NAD/FAD-binding protein